jgi:hypothetical protein
VYSLLDDSELESRGSLHALAGAVAAGISRSISPGMFRFALGASFGTATRTLIPDRIESDEEGRSPTSVFGAALEVVGDSFSF